MNTMTEEQMINIGKGAHISPVDENDWTLASAGAPTAYATSCFIDLSWRTASMQDQIGCCVGCTFEEIVAQIVHAIAQATGIPYQELSFRFVYAVCKCLEGTQGYESFARSPEGTYPALAAKVVRKYGVPLAKFCPNETLLDHESFVFQRNLANIPQVAFTDALTRRSGADFAVAASEDGIKQAITYAKANNGGVAILRQIGDSYWRAPNGVASWDATGTNSILPIQAPKTIISGHEEFLYGYDYEPKTNRMRIYWLNHWSPKWAANGRGWEYADVWMKYIGEIRVVVANVPTVQDFKYIFTKTLTRGMKGADVVALQHVLKLEGCFPVDQAFTGNYGDLTFSGVEALQTKYASEILTPIGLTVPTGNVGSATLAWINKKYN